MSAISKLYRQARKETRKLREAQNQQICLAILEGESKIGLVREILGKRFVPDSETLNVAAAGDSTQIFELIADAGSFSDGDFEMADKANRHAHKEVTLYCDMDRVINRHRGELKRAGLLETYRAPKAVSKAVPACHPHLRVPGR